MTETGTDLSVAEESLIQALHAGDIEAVGVILRYIASIDPTTATRLLDVMNTGLKLRGVR